MLQTYRYFECDRSNRTYKTFDALKLTILAGANTERLRSEKRINKTHSSAPAGESINDADLDEDRRSQLQNKILETVRTWNDFSSPETRWGKEVSFYYFPGFFYYSRYTSPYATCNANVHDISST